MERALLSRRAEKARLQIGAIRHEHAAAGGPQTWTMEIRPIRASRAMTRRGGGVERPNRLILSLRKFLMVSSIILIFVIMLIISLQGDMELDNEKDLDTDKECKKAMEAAKNLNMNHEDLSDVSDLDDSIGSHSDEETLEKQASELRQKIEEIRKPETDVPRLSEKVY